MTNQEKFSKFGLSKCEIDTGSPSCFAKKGSSKNFIRTYRQLSMLVVACLICFTISGNVKADILLNGGIMSRVNNTGFNSGEPWEYCSFNTPNIDLFFNGLTGTPILLNDGLNNFTVTGQDGSSTGLGLFLTTSNTLLTEFGRAPDLNVFLPSSGGFAHPAAGTLVATIGQFSGNAAYSGATSFEIDGKLVDVTAWNGSSLTLRVSTIPEPSGFALVAVIGLIATIRRSRSK